MASSGQVLVRSWPSVLAVTMPRVSGKVDIAHRMIQATSADLPMPWPEATAIRTASSGDMQALAELLQDLALPGLGAASPARAVPGCPQGKADRT